MSEILEVELLTIFLEEALGDFRAFEVIHMSFRAGARIGNFQ